jgi:anti-sigma factor RsiW
MTQTIDHLNPDTLSAFVDGELAATESQTVQQHLSGCHRCALRVLSSMQLKAAVARAGLRYAPSPEALARLTARLQPKLPSKTARIYPFRPMAWTALAATLLLAVSLLGWRQIHQTNELAAELLDQHLATLSSGATPEVISTDRHTVKPWFQGKLPFSFNLPETLPTDMVLKGGDFTYLNGQPAALLVFTIHKHEVSVFLTQRTGDLIQPGLPGIRSGFAIQRATTHDLRIIAVSDVNPADLDVLVKALVQVQSLS